MQTDLHLHTIYSDGTLTPKEIVAKAKKLGMGLLSVCDHNTVAAYPELFQLCNEAGITLIHGVEIDCYMGQRYIHVLGYGFDIGNAQLLALLADCAEKMQYQNDAVIFNMAEDYGINLEEYHGYVSPPEIGGYKNSNFLLHKGIIQSIPEYFPLHRKYGVDMQEIGLPQLDRVCEIIKEAGGVPVLAHPWDRLDRENFLHELQAGVDAGIMGLECYYPSHNERITRTCLDFCVAHNLLTTAGSDEHGLFNRIIDGVVYEMGEIVVDNGQLNLDGLL